MRKILFAAFAALSLSTFAQSESPKFTPVKENPITSIKDQHRSGTCWSYSGLGFFEAELLRLGKGEFDLCESFVVEHTYMDRADRAVRTHGDVSFANGGSFYDVLYCLKKYGIVPEGTMPFPGSLYGDSLFNFQELDPIMNGYVKSIAKSEAKKRPLSWKKEFGFILENYFGPYPTSFEDKGQTYTPESFRASLDECMTLGADNITVHTLSLKKGSRITLEGSRIPGGADVAKMLDYAGNALRKHGYAPYYLYRQKYMSGSFENVGWSLPGAESLYNICIMEELHGILSLGAGGSTKMVGRGESGDALIRRVFNAKYPKEYMERPEKWRGNLDAFAEFYQGKGI